MSDFDLDTFLPYQLAVVASDVSAAFSVNYKASHGLSRAEWRIICHLAGSAEKPLSVRDLETCAHLEKSKVSRAVSNLEARGLVEKRVDEHDKRLISVTLSEKGNAVFTELVPIANRFDANLRETLTQEENAILTTCLEKISNKIAR